MPMLTLRKLRRFAFQRLLLALPDELAVRVHHFRVTGNPYLRLRRPRTFNEKIQHRKLYERDPRMPPLVDKIEVKNFVSEKLGSEWIIPTLFEGPTLPPREERNWPLPFVIKPSHSSGPILFVRSRTHVDWPHIETTCAEWSASMYGQAKREWQYSQIKPRILVEPYIGGDLSPPDYKFFVFDSRVHYVEVDIDRHATHTQVFFDRGWRRQPFRREYPAYESDVPAPASLDRMIAAAEVLGAGWPFLRVDFYEVNGAPKFGELTFCPASGNGRFHPAEWDRVLGDLWPD